jgi:DNA-directed RNA polymerase specialized sigma24 family protein
MTPDAEAHFIALWPQGLETAAIAAQLGIPRGTVSSRAHRLQQQDSGSDVTSNRRR